MKNHADALIVSPSKRSLLWLFVSERKQIALMAEEKSPSRISLRLLATKLLGNEVNMSYKVIDEIIKDAISAGEIAGANCLAKQGGKELFYYQEGYADIENRKLIERDTIFRLYSMTKPITSAAVMLLA